MLENNLSLKDIQKYIMSNYFIWGKHKDRVHIGKNVSLVNTLLNTSSGHIYIGNNTIFGHNCMVLTGTHSFIGDKRASLSGKDEIPDSGYDIHIGTGCWIASGAIITGSVCIGNNVIVAAGSVVIKDIPDDCLVAGVPAKIKRNNNE